MKRSITHLLHHSVVFLVNVNKNEMQDQDWQEIYTTFADVKPLYETGHIVQDKYAFGNVLSEAFCVFRIRFTEKVNVKMRILYKRRMFEIKKIINQDEESKILKIIALEL